MKTRRYVISSIACMFIWLVAGAAQARMVTVAWDANPASENVSGYLLYYGTQSRSGAGFTGYATEVDAGNVTQYAVNLPDDTAAYYLAVKAYNGQGLRSDYSAEVRADPTVQNFTIAASAGANGTISPSGSVTVSSGASQTFSINPATSYHVGDVTVDGQSVGAVTSYAFTNVTANHTIAATFAVNTYTLTASAGSGGTISPSGAVSINSGGSRTFTIAPSTGYHVADVTVDGQSVGAVTTYRFTNVTANHTIAATFAVNTYTLTASAGSGGTISPSGAVSINSGGSRTFTIAPSTGYHVADVTVDGQSVGAVTSYAFTNVTANHTIAATFAVNTYTLTASAGSGGTISPSGSVSINSGGSRTFTIAPSTGYHVADVTVDGQSVGAVTSYAFTNVTANHTIAATFAVNTYTLTASAGSGGTISPSGSVSINSGGSRTFTIASNPGYQLSDVMVDGQSIGPVTSHTFTNVTTDHSIAATFSPVATPPTVPKGLRIVSVTPGGSG